jgi:hypothetical protein
VDIHPLPSSHPAEVIALLHKPDREKPSLNTQTSFASFALLADKEPLYSQWQSFETLANSCGEDVLH